MTRKDYDDDVRSDPNLRKSDVNPWAWVLGFVLLLALGYAIFEAFDDTDATPERQAIPAAGQIEGENAPRQDSGPGETGGVGAQRGEAPGDRGDMTTP